MCNTIKIEMGIKNNGGLSFMNSKSVFFGILGAAVAIPLAGSVVSGSWRADTIEGAENGVLASGEIAIDTSHFPDKEFRP